MRTEQGEGSPADPPADHAPKDCPGAEERELLQHWHAMQSGFRRLNDRLLAEVAAGTGVAASSFQVLWHLLTAPGRSAPMRELTETLGFSTAGTTKVVDRLAQQGLVDRRPSRTDRRVVHAVLTEEGAATATAAARALAGALRRHLVAPLGPEGCAALLGALLTLEDAAADGPAA
ncbi:MarR family winged helix-turn-helix transcriptional regulator [Streptomyces xiamenensis]